MNFFLQAEEDPDERDAETRVAAVKALALVAHKLFGSVSRASGQAVHDKQPAVNDNAHTADDKQSAEGGHIPAAGHQKQAADASMEPIGAKQSDMADSISAADHQSQAADASRPTVDGKQSALGDRQSAVGGKTAASNHQREAADRSIQPDPAAAVCVREHVLGALLTAVEDYSTDNRSASAFYFVSGSIDAVYRGAISKGSNIQQSAKCLT